MVPYLRLAILFVAFACERDGAGPPRQPTNQPLSAETASVLKDVTLKVEGMS